VNVNRIRPNSRIVVVESWMSKEPITVDVATAIRDAMALLQRFRIRRLLVTNDGLLVGIVTKNDLAHHPGTDPVGGIMSPEPKTVTAVTALEDAARVMIDGKIGALPVVDSAGRPVGIITESDTLRALIASISVTGPGLRLSLKGEDPDEVVCYVVEAALRHRMRILSILVTGFGNDRRILAKLTGEHADAVIAEIWRSGHTVMSAHRY
jgi:acetoin utilization protein AcuB